MSTAERKGPLASLRVVEFSGLGPAPLAGQLLADLGADVITIDRKAAPGDPADINRRGKRSVVLDLKTPEGHAAARAMISSADVLIEGFRPGVMERLGLGPTDCSEKLIYGRMTGWGQTGPWAQTAGHDINYLALTGALHAMGSADAPPVPPLNMVADYGGGTMFLLFGILAAVIERGVTGKGQIVDAAMVDGVPAMMGLIHGMFAQGTWSEARAANWLDGAAPFYRCYTCADGKFVAVGALEPQFYAILLEKLDLPADYGSSQNDTATWAERTAEFAAAFATRSRDDWAAHFDGSDACVAPVLSFSEAPDHPQMASRGNMLKMNGVLQSGHAPRFGSGVPVMPSLPRPIGADTEAVLAEIGVSLSRP
ncbi:CaiB/BaiF CoA transferase family protein [Sulfitobacter dubius]|uniref:Acetyl-CoA:oxalate CoA-transferase n=1 Tax=Sulfitobacter dubius TaxID=218673 RepID=A0ABY3ZGS4_9RHOB|nr:CaiB/BaiF CoA-transferase family protein [Sulfitobacter dubius]UOA13389.1 Acetyl-CoA:oxalate CoA-transferase [Sulfitobacter dubius]